MKPSPKPSPPSPLTDSELVDYWLQWVNRSKSALGGTAFDVQFGDVYVGTIGYNRPPLTREILANIVGQSITARITQKLKS